METLHEEALAAAGARPDGTIDINTSMRSMLEGLLNAVTDEQASELGVPRNGYRKRGLDTCVGTVTLRIPRLREGGSFPDDVVRRWSRTNDAQERMSCEIKRRTRVVQVSPPVRLAGQAGGGGVLRPERHAAGLEELHRPQVVRARVRARAPARGAGRGRQGAGARPRGVRREERRVA